MSVLDPQRVRNRASRKLAKDVRRDVQTKDAGDRAEHGDDADPEVIEGGQLVDVALRVLLLVEREELDVGLGLFGRVDDGDA